MENRNLVLAVVLCLIILFGWGRFAEYMGWVKPPQPPVETADTASSPPARSPAPSPTLPVFQPSQGRDFSVSTPLYDAIFYTGGGVLRSFVLKNYHTGILPDSPLINMVDGETAKFAPLGLVINSLPSWSVGEWTLEENIQNLDIKENEKANFTVSGVVDGLRISRHFEIDADTYFIREITSISNPASQPKAVRVSLTHAMNSAISSGSQYDSMRIAWDDNGKLDDETSASKLESSGIIEKGLIWWAGPMNTYFLAAAMPGDPDNVTVRGRLQENVWRVGVEEKEILLGSGESVELQAGYWTGPKVRQQLAAVSEQLAKSIDLGFFSLISKGLLWLLEFFNQYVHNWGVSIILLTCLIKAIFWPLTDKSYASMEKMKKLQPMMLALREKYKDNKEQLNKEIMGLYKSHGANPASGCVPILIQLPVFFGLYQALLTSIALRHASFITYLPGTHIIWLADLSAKDPLYITPIIMGLTMFIQQRMSPAPVDPIQQKVMLFLPLIFTVLFINLPAGLVLYWLMNNILTIFQQWLAIRKYRRPESSARK